MKSHYNLDISDYSAMLETHSLGTSVHRTLDGGAEWISEGNLLRNRRAEYFSIGIFKNEKVEPILLMEQKETALVMLLAANIQGKDAVLLSLRTEPGLIGLTNFSTTIQSTPSNYLRKHGGKATPFIEIAADPCAYGDVIYEGEHHDWGDYYLNKTKRFLIVELVKPIEAPEGFCWVDLDTVQALLLEDNFVTNDLRVPIPFLDARTIQDSVQHSVKTPETGPPLQSQTYSSGIIDSRGTSVAFFQTQTQTREVGSWVQPLLVPQGSMRIDLVFYRQDSGLVFGVEKRTQPGLLGVELWFPAKLPEGKVIHRVKTSAEGGRFWKFPIEITIQCLEDSNVGNDGVVWMPAAELSALIKQQMITSLELRMAWSVVWAAGLHLK